MTAPRVGRSSQQIRPPDDRMGVIVGLRAYACNLTFAKLQWATILTHTVQMHTDVPRVNRRRQMASLRLQRSMP